VLIKPRLPGSGVLVFRQPYYLLKLRTRIKIQAFKNCFFRLPEMYNPCGFPLGAAESERILAGEGCAMFERSEFAPAAKICGDEGSLRSKPATGVAFLCLLSRRRRASRERSKESRWSRGHEAQSKTIRKCIKIQLFF
jgi:hypothetical protein